MVGIDFTTVEYIKEHRSKVLSIENKLKIISFITKTALQNKPNPII